MMPEKSTVERAEKDKREGKAPSRFSRRPVRCCVGRGHGE